MKTLYLSDLDGTLLNSDGLLSVKSADILNFLLGKGLLFTVATARTSATVLDMFSGVNLNLPLILMNGVVLFDTLKYKNILCHSIDKAAADEILSFFYKKNKAPMLYFQKEGYLEIHYNDLNNEYQMDYVGNRKELSKKIFLYKEKLNVTDDDNLIYIVTLDKPEQISDIRDSIVKADKVTCAFYPDNYTDCNFLECMNKNASKATAALELKKLLKVDRIVAFGDNLNDIPMFEIADECYAVSNSCDELKAKATGIIGSNDEDSVAEFLLQCYHNGKI